MDGERVATTNPPPSCPQVKGSKRQQVPVFFAPCARSQLQLTSRASPRTREVPKINENVKSTVGSSPQLLTAAGITSYVGVESSRW